MKSHLYQPSAVEIHTSHVYAKHIKVNLLEISIEVLCILKNKMKTNHTQRNTIYARFKLVYQRTCTDSHAHTLWIVHNCNRFESLKRKTHQQINELHIKRKIPQSIYEFHWIYHLIALSGLENEENLCSLSLHER